MKKILNIGIVVAVLFFGFTAVTHAASFVVDSLADTSDSNPGDGICDDGTGDCTLRAAVQEANALVGPDTITFSVSGIINVGAPIDVFDDELTITGPGTDSGLEIKAPNQLFNVSSADYFSLSDLLITDIPRCAVCSQNSSYGTYTNLVVVGVSDNSGVSLFEFENNNNYNTVDTIYASGGSLGLRFKSESEYNSVSNSSFIDNGHSGITLYSANNNTVFNNHIEGSDDFGMYVIFGSQDNTIEENTVINNNLTGITIGEAHEITLEKVSGNSFINNTVSGNGGGGIGGGNNSEYNIFTGNVITNNGGAGIILETGDILQGSTISGNTFTGVFVQTASDVTIGGPNENEGNSISQTIEGFSQGPGILIENGSSILIQGNTIFDNLTNGITIEDGESITILGNIIGSDSDYIASPNLGWGISISNESGSNIIIGDQDIPSSGNNISNNGEGGILIAGSNVVEIAHNEITQNENVGIFLDVVTEAIVFQNSISEHNDKGIEIIESSVIVLQGNEVLFNGSEGISVGNSSDIQIGGDEEWQGNLVSGHVTSEDGIGIGIAVVFSEEIVVMNNKVGTNELGEIEDGYGNSSGMLFISGVLVQENIVIGNLEAGVVVLGYINPEDPDEFLFPTVSIISNSIFENNGMGIELMTTGDLTTFSDQGPNVNDAGDADVGPNDYLNTPIIHSANIQTGDVVYSLDVPAGTYYVEFFLNPTTGTFGEGELFLGSDELISTGTSVQKTVNFELPLGAFVTATATEYLGPDSYGATSEFSQAYVPLEDEEPAPEVRQRSSSGSIVYTCKDPLALNYSRFGASQPSLCQYTQNNQTSSVNEIIGSGLCPANLIVSNFMRQGDRNGNYSNYYKSVITEVNLLQSHINRILQSVYTQAAGPVDGIFGPLTKQGVMRLQTALNTVIQPSPNLVIDGIVGPFTREAINNSCGNI